MNGDGRRFSILKGIERSRRRGKIQTLDGGLKMAAGFRAQANLRSLLCCHNDLARQRV
jgi:hypothetical protein